MKKAILSLALALVITIGSISGSQLFAGTMNTEIPDVEKKVKKESSKTSKKSTDTKASNINQTNSDPSDKQDLQSTAKDDFDQNNPALNDDCTKEGFDKE